MSYFRRRGPHRVVAKLNDGPAFGIGPGVIIHTGDYLVLDCAGKGRAEDGYAVPAHLFERDYEPDPDQSDPKEQTEKEPDATSTQAPSEATPEAEPPHGAIPPTTPTT